MPLQLNGVDVSTLQYNGVAVNELQLNGVTVWTAGPVVSFNPSSYDAASGYDLSVSMEARGLLTITDSDAGDEVSGTWVSPALETGKSYSVVVTNHGIDSYTLRVDAYVGTTQTFYIAKGQTASFTFTPTQATHWIRVRNSTDVTGQTARFKVKVGQSEGEFYLYA